MARWHKTEWDMLPEHAFRPRPGGMTFEGGTSTPAPDPRLVEAQVRNLGVQDDMIQQIFQNTNDMAPVQKEQTQFALDTARQSWEQSQSDREYAIGRRDELTGLQDTMIQGAKTFNTEAKRKELAGQVAVLGYQLHDAKDVKLLAELAGFEVLSQHEDCHQAPGVVVDEAAQVFHQFDYGLAVLAKSRPWQLSRRAALQFSLAARIPWPASTSSSRG